MSIQITIPVTVLYYTKKQFDDWAAGNRENCLDPYCSRLPHTYGFGEQLVGDYFTSQGYKWIHHDYNFFGGNKLGKYPLAEEIIFNTIGAKKYESTRTLYNAFKATEEPDLLIYKPDFSEIRFAESKRLDTKDKLRESQVRCLALYALLFGCKVDIFEIAKVGVLHEPKPIVWEF
jgi:hypothetical protein